jgi:hypothetical protein
MVKKEENQRSRPAAPRSKSKAEFRQHPDLIYTGAEIPALVL